MRTLAVLVLCVACTGTTATTQPPVGAGSQPVRTQRTDVKAPGNLPVRTESELAAEADAREACMAGCGESDDACRATCDQEHPIMQVEVVPDLPVDPR